MERGCGQNTTMRGLDSVQDPMGSPAGSWVLAYLHEAQQLNFPQKLGFVGC